MFLSDLVHALQAELKYLFLDKNGTVILDTTQKDDITYGLPLCILEIGDGGESARLPGNGITRLDFDFSLRVYAYEPNAYNDDDGGYSNSLLDIIDTVRNYFENEVWTTQEMIDLTTNYGFRLTFSGINKAEPLENGEQIVMGYRIGFNTIALDQITLSTYDLLDNHAGTVTGSVVFE